MRIAALLHQTIARAVAQLIGPDPRPGELSGLDILDQAGVDAYLRWCAAGCRPISTCIRADVEPAAAVTTERSTRAAARSTGSTSRFDPATMGNSPSR